jgi:hypothetical protein
MVESESTHSNEHKRLRTTVHWGTKYRFTVTLPDAIAPKDAAEIREWLLKSSLRSALSLHVVQKGEEDMALVPFLARDQISVEDLHRAEKVIGRVLNFHKVVAHSPRALSGYLVLSEALKEMKLDRKLRELAYLRTAQLNRCPY